MTLFEDGEPAKPKRVKKPATEADAAVKRCIDRFYDRFVAKWNRGVDVATTPKSQLVTPLVSGGKHGAQFKRLLAAWDEGTVLELVDTFFTTLDPQVVRSDYSYDAFFRLAQALRLAKARRQPVDDRTLQNLDAAARATGKRR